MVSLLKMRRRHLLLLVLSSFLIWGLATYFIFVQCPGCYKEEEMGASIINDEKVILLERKIDDLVRSNSVLFGAVKIHINQMLKVQEKTENQSEHEHKNAHRGVSVKKNDGSNVDQLEVKFESSTEEIFNPEFLLKPTSNISQDQQLMNVPKKILEDGRPVIAVLVFSCNRVTIRRCLNRLLKFRPSKQQFPIIVTQDCSHKATLRAIAAYGDQISLIKQPDQKDIEVPLKERKFKGYFKIARHYGWALNQTFFVYGFNTVIIVEDDLDVSEDFFEYFLGTYWLLWADPSLWCVSAWNDNGNEGLVDGSQPHLLYRTDFFPGLGWMLTNTLWAELSGKWPPSYWDDWIRQPEQRKGRACVRPEISRTKTFGKIGVSNGVFYEKHLKYVKLNEEFVSFAQMNVSYLLKDNYDRLFVKQVYDSPSVSYRSLRGTGLSVDGPVRVTYNTKGEYLRVAMYLGLMDDLRSGVARTAYRGIVSVFFNGRRVFIAPKLPWRGYNTTWS